MARPREFDSDQVLDAAVRVFRDHGFEGASAQMLVDAMRIGRQSLYDSFGDKWQLYRAAVRRYSADEVSAHIAALDSGPRAIDGIAAMLDRVVAGAATACLGINSICEFGRARADLSEIHDAAGNVLHAAIADRLRDAQRDGHAASELDPDNAASFLTASIAGIRIAARGGAGTAALADLARMAMRAIV